MPTVNLLKSAFLAACAAVCLAPPCFAAAQDADTREVQSYVLTDAALSRYSQATRNLAALPPGSCAEDDGDDTQSASLTAMAAKLDAMPGAGNAIRSAGMTTREYVVFSMSLLHNGLASWAISQPGGKLPPGASKANVEFVSKHAAELKELEDLGNERECDDGAEEEEETEE